MSLENITAICVTTFLCTLVLTLGTCTAHDSYLRTEKEKAAIAAGLSQELVGNYPLWKASSK